LGAEQFFNKDNIVYDYGSTSAETSSLVKSYLYQQTPDMWQFGRALLADDAKMISGHVNISRFMSILGVSQTLTFVRAPLQRMASEYAHFVRNYNYQGSFHDFYSRTFMCNRQSKILQGVDIESVGFVGLTERYSEGLQLLNARYGIEIPQREDNRGKPSLGSLHAISAEDEAELRNLNKSDIALYQKAVDLFDLRLAQFQNGKIWAHARLVEASVKNISGWAWWESSDHEPVDVEIWINGVHEKTVASVNHRPGLCRLVPPRGGYVGFQLQPKLVPGDQVQCRIAATGQCFPLAPCRVQEPNL
jgi:hypothetical protein